MPAWGVDIRLDEVTPRFRRWNERMREEVAKEVDVVGQDMEDLAKSLAPVRTGALRESIFHRVNPETLTLEFGNNVDYGLFVEVGTRMMAARPHIRPSLDAYSQRLLDAILVGALNAFRA